MADGVILNIANRDPEYLKVVNGGMFSICDSSYVPLYIKWIYGVRLSNIAAVRSSWISSAVANIG